MPRARCRAGRFQADRRRRIPHRRRPAAGAAGAPTSAAYTQICRLITARAAPRAQGQLPAQSADFASRPRRLPGAVAAIRRAADAGARGCWLRERFPRPRLWLAVELHRGARDAARLAALTATRGRAADCRAVAAGDVHMHRRSRRRLQDVLTAIRHGCTVASAGATAVSEWRAAPAIAGGAAARLSAGAARREHCAIAARCRFSLGELHYEYPAGAGARRRRAPAEHLRALTDRGPAAALAGRHATGRAGADREGTGADRRAAATSTIS